MESSLQLSITRFSVSNYECNSWADTETDIVIYYKANIVDRKQTAEQITPIVEQTNQLKDDTPSEPEVLL